MIFLIKFLKRHGKSMVTNSVNTPLVLRNRFAKLIEFELPDYAHG